MLAHEARQIDDVVAEIDGNRLAAAVGQQALPHHGTLEHHLQTAVALRDLLLPLEPLALCHAGAQAIGEKPCFRGIGGVVIQLESSAIPVAPRIGAGKNREEAGGKTSGPAIHASLQQVTGNLDH